MTNYLFKPKAYTSKYELVSARKHLVSDFQRFNYPYPKGSKPLKIIAPFRVGVYNDFQHTEFSCRHELPKITTISLTPKVPVKI
jgi:hypothetical protein